MPRVRSIVQNQNVAFPGMWRASSLEIKLTHIATMMRFRFVLVSSAQSMAQSVQSARAATQGSQAGDGWPRLTLRLRLSQNIKWRDPAEVGLNRAMPTFGRRHLCGCWQHRRRAGGSAELGASREPSDCSCRRLMCIRTIIMVILLQQRTSASQLHATVGS